MRKIRKLYFFDKKKVQEMISFLNNSATDTYINHIMFNPLAFLHHFLPLKWKFLPESYVLKDENEVKGLITVAPASSRQKKVEIKKLFFEENSLIDATELIQFAVSKYKSIGAVSVLVKVDDYLIDLLSVFVNKCGFSKISYEKLWKINQFNNFEYDKREFRSFKNSDAQAIANLYNDALLPHFRPLLGKDTREFKESTFKGLSYKSEYKYVIEDKKTRNVIGCVSITTSDNENFVIDVIQTSWIVLDINSIISFATAQIRKRKKKFGLFIKTQRYTTLGENYESQFLQNGFECVQNQIVLTNSSAKVLRTEEKSGKYTVLSDFCPSSAMPNRG